jgi:hypothetical protein
LGSESLRPNRGKWPEPNDRLWPRRKRWIPYSPVGGSRAAFANNGGVRFVFGSKSVKLNYVLSKCVPWLG